MAAEGSKEELTPQQASCCLRLCQTTFMKCCWRDTDCFSHLLVHIIVKDEDGRFPLEHRFPNRWEKVQATYQQIEKECSVMINKARSQSIEIVSEEVANFLEKYVQCAVIMPLFLRLNATVVMWVVTPLLPWIFFVCLLLLFISCHVSQSFYFCATQRGYSDSLEAVLAWVCFLTNYSFGFLMTDPVVLLTKMQIAELEQELNEHSLVLKAGKQRKHNLIGIIEAWLS